MEYDEFVAREYDSLRRFAIVVAGSVSVGEDALHDGLISVAGMWARVRPETAAAYTRQAVVRKVIDRARRDSRWSWTGVPDSSVDFDFLRFEGDRELFARLRLLPANQRAALVLRFYLDLSDAESARCMGCARATVRSHVHRGLAALRRSASEAQGEAISDG